jgi:hypothetical protein
MTRAMNRLVQYISVDGPTLFAFNPDIRPRSDVIEAECEPNRQIVDLATGQPLPMDVVLDHRNGWRRVRLLAAGVPSLGCKAYGGRRESSPVLSLNTAHMASWGADSPCYRLTVDSSTGGDK